jgi:hypothetical protein
MATLTSSDRKSMPSSEFAGKGKSFPVNDDNHARLAISGATRSEHAGNISSSEEDAIKAKAREKLGEKGGMDYKAAVAKMHPEHVHKLVQDAHAGKYGPQAQQAAQSAMQPPQGDTGGDPNAVPPAQAGKGSMFSSGSGPAAAPAGPPASRGSIFGSGR